jgi:UDP-N-acetylglucosamine--N-acetylmuramyl-(pentapeptide) pyrophosphoryl-undecaprenol N-acetylglucosamine transferase
MSAARPVMIMAGGTGGHVFPGLAVAEALRARGLDVVWLGTRRGLEARLVPAADIPMEWIGIGGLRGKGLRTRLMAPLRLASALAQALGILLRRRPRVVVGFGGFVAGPGGLMAAALRIPLVLHEQNAVPGLTNRWLARFAKRVFTGFPVELPGDKTRRRYVGNPVRADIAALAPPAQRLAGREGAIRLLVIGGSQGAAALNRSVPAAVAQLPAETRPEIWHQAGERHLEAAKSAYAQAGVEARVEPFVADMAAAYAWADLVICRSGALTVAELAAAGVPALLVPFPYAVDDHQRVNGRFLVEAGAAVMVIETELTPQRLAHELQQLVDRSRLLAMAEAARSVARVDAAAAVAEACEELAGNGRRRAA